MRYQALSWWLPTSYIFRPSGKYCRQQSPQRHNNRLMWIAN